MSVTTWIFEPEEVEAAKEAETRNCEESVIRQLYANYYKVLAPILEKYGEINLDDYREGKHERD